MVEILLLGAVVASHHFSRSDTHGSHFLYFTVPKIYHINVLKMQYDLFNTIFTFLDTFLEFLYNPDRQRFK